MPSAGFEPAIPASEWPQTHAVYRAATGSDLLGVVDEVKKKRTPYVDRHTMSIRLSVTYCQRLNRLSDFHEIRYTNWLHSKEIISRKLEKIGRKDFIYRAQRQRSTLRW
jgi:predicted DNA-binding protein